ncbi:MAG: DUF1361 domain-containing protein [Actinomycetota bacterium]
MIESVLWNLLLAVIPVALGYALAWLLKRKLTPVGVVLLALPLALGWLGFLPNTCYLLTEWRHLLFDSRWEPMLDAAHRSPVEMYNTAKWALFFLVYSALGVIFFVLAVRPMEHWLRSKGQLPYLYAPFFFFLVSLGVYLGLIKRFNTWDLLGRPMFIWNTAVQGVTSQPILLAIGVFGLILWALYEAGDIWVDGVASRFKKGGGGAPAPKTASRKKK